MTSPPSVSSLAAVLVVGREAALASQSLAKPECTHAGMHSPSGHVPQYFTLGPQRPYAGSTLRPKQSLLRYMDP